MWGCSSRALVRASRTNRSASPGDGVRPRSRTFTATSWPRSWSRTRNTAANPPSPSTSPTVNFLPRAFWRRRRSVVRSSDMAAALGVDGAHGFWSAIRAAWRHRDRLRGASTITQQLAKNLYLSSSRSPIRKLKEAATALGLELVLSKDRILELYLNVAEWGPGIWGIDAASRAYFGVPASRLSPEQAAELAATLPHPRTSNPTFRPERTLERRNLILARYRGVDVYIPPEEETDTIPVPTVLLPPVDSLQIDSLPPVDSLQDSLTPRRTDAQGKTADSGRDSLP